jgi:hypothetical protein
MANNQTLLISPFFDLLKLKICTLQRKVIVGIGHCNLMFFDGGA